MLIEHDIGLVMAISHRIAVIDFGVKIGEGTPDEISKNELLYIDIPSIKCQPEQNTEENWMPLVQRKAFRAKAGDPGGTPCRLKVVEALANNPNLPMKKS